jgi:hypothetical protein
MRVIAGRTKLLQERSDRWASGGSPELGTLVAAMGRTPSVYVEGRSGARASPGQSYI